MVSSLSIVFMFVTLILCFALPVVLLFLLFKRTRAAFVCGLLGALGFFVPQICIRLPLLSTAAVQTFLGTLPVIPMYLVLALTAALFETSGRFLVFSLFFKKPAYGYYEGLAAGVGHGGIEAIFLIGTAYINNIAFSFLLNNGGLEPILTAAGLSAKDVNLLIAQLTGTAPATFLLSGVERVATILLHVVLSVTLFSYMRANKALIGFCIVTTIHTCVDFFIPYLQYVSGSIFITELILILVVAATMLLLVPAKKRFKSLNPVSDISQ
ncbi:MAG: YhfC family glutamic-type intramembrane protease [Oscillospiraceae bacterium]|nr:YhfC family glutamic-type intramembrane protease [Oscillospiraceae bacterium]